MARITLGALTVIDVHGRRAGEGRGRGTEGGVIGHCTELLYKAYIVNNGWGRGGGE